jgi:hypothetical protein
MENCCVFFVVGTEPLNVIWTNFGFKGLRYCIRDHNVNLREDGSPLPPKYVRTYVCVCARMPVQVYLNLRVYCVRF